MKALTFSAYSTSKAATAAILAEVATEARNAEEERRAADPRTCPHCYGDGTSHDQPDGCSACNGSGQRQRSYLNHYGRDWDDPDD